MSFVVKGLRDRSNSEKRKIEIEQRKCDLEKQHLHELQLQRLSGIIELAKACLNLAIITNGVAIITLFTYFAGVVKQQPSLSEQNHALVMQFYPAIISYTVGVVLGGCLVFFSWLAQTLYYTYGSGSNAANLFRSFAAASGVASLVLFAVGSLLAVNGFAP